MSMIHLLCKLKYSLLKVLSNSEGLLKLSLSSKKLTATFIPVFFFSERNDSDDEMLSFNDSNSSYFPASMTSGLLSEMIIVLKRFPSHLL